MKKISAPSSLANSRAIADRDLEIVGGGFWQAAAGFVGGEAANVAAGGGLPEPGSGINQVEETVEGFLGEKKNKDRWRTGDRYN
jgi:hypothetical protein